MQWEVLGELTDCGGQLPRASLLTLQPRVVQDQGVDPDQDGIVHAPHPVVSQAPSS